MDKQRKKGIRKVGKQVIKKQSIELQNILQYQNPISTKTFIFRNVWMRNHKVIVLKDKEIEDSITGIISRNELEKNYVIIPMHYNGNIIPDNPPPLLFCGNCNCYIPTWLSKDSGCKCGRVGLPGSESMGFCENINSAPLVKISHKPGGFINNLFRKIISVRKILNVKRLKFKDNSNLENITR